MKLDSVGSVKSSGREKLREPVEDDSFIAKELLELGEHKSRNSFVFSRFNRSSNYRLQGRYYQESN